MDRKDIITMSREEIRRVGVIEQIREGRITQAHGGKVLGLSDRQIRRIVQRVKAEGESGGLHRLRGQPSNHRTNPKKKTRILVLYDENYSGFGPPLAAEKLWERNHLRVHPETLRQWLQKEGRSYPQRKGKRHRSWRERKACLGELVQMDGSHHDWLEGRGPQMVLLGYIDDATGRVYGRFYDHEGTLPAVDSFRRYSEKYGLPQGLYVDRHTTYKSPKKLSLEEELAGKEESQSQFERALEELGVSLRYASSPQAKGRIERCFKTLQDRLVKEMRLAGIVSLEEANRFLEGYLPQYNQRFCRVAANPTDVHRPVPRDGVLSAILCIKEYRTVRKDGTLQYKTHQYQLHSAERPRRIEVQEWWDGSIHLADRQKNVAFQEIFPSPKIRLPRKEAPKRIRIKTLPAKNHPWRHDPVGKAKNKIFCEGKILSRGTPFKKRCSPATPF